MTALASEVERIPAFKLPTHGRAIAIATIAANLVTILVGMLTAAGIGNSPPMCSSAPTCARLGPWPTSTASYLDAPYLAAVM